MSSRQILIVDLILMRTQQNGEADKDWDARPRLPLQHGQAQDARFEFSTASPWLLRGT